MIFNQHPIGPQYTGLVASVGRRSVIDARTPRDTSRSVLAAVLVGVGVVVRARHRGRPGPWPDDHPWTPPCMRSSARRSPPAAVTTDADAADHRIDVRVPRTLTAPDLDGDSHATQIARKTWSNSASLRRLRVQLPCTACPICADEGRGARDAALQGHLRRAVSFALSRRRWFSLRRLGAQRFAEIVMTGWVPTASGR